MKQLKDCRRAHLVGIGGAGMSALAAILLDRGVAVSGSDLTNGPTVERLTRAGATIHRGHRAENLGEPDLVVCSTAIRPDNPERIEAARRGIEIWRRARLLGEIMRDRRGLAIAGAHGKTTTTSMMGAVLTEAGFDPTVLIGGDLPAFGGNARVGRGEWVVAEADESDASFLDLEPDRIVITNIEADHLDHYRDVEHIIDTFGEFIARLRPGGGLTVCLDSEPLMGLVRRIGAPALTYSMRDPGADLFADEARTIAGAASGDSGAVDFITEFTPVFRGERLAPVRLRVPGRHNVANALGVMLTALEMGCAPERIASALGAFGGARRRFEVKGAAAGVTVIDDYAHHPTEIRATLAAARSTNGNGAGGRVVAVFQPHRYSRTAKMAVEFGEAFAEADLLVITDVYGAGEDPIEGVTGCAIWERAVAVGHPDAHYLADARQAAAFLQSKLRRGDMMLTMGAGDIWRAGEELLALLRQSDSASLMSAASTSSAKSAAVAARQRKPRPRKPIRPESAHAPRRAN